MDSKLILTGLLGLAMLAPLAAQAEDAPAPAAPAAKAAPGKVAQALAPLPTLNGTRPNLNARYYIYLCSASWCGPCNRGMPRVVEAYKEMQAEGIVELILVSYDRTEEAARQFVERFGGTFPCLARVNGDKLPGYTAPRGIPHAIIVDAEGKRVNEGHGYMVAEYKRYIDSYEQQAGLPPSFPAAQEKH